jgi:hypothetical protein
MTVVGFLVGLTLGATLTIVAGWRHYTILRDQFRYAEQDVNARKTQIEHECDRYDRICGRIQSFSIQRRRTADSRSRGPLP